MARRTLTFAEAVLGGIRAAIAADLTDSSAHSAQLRQVGDTGAIQKVEAGDLILRKGHARRRNMLIGELHHQPGAMERRLHIAGARKRQQCTKAKQHDQSHQCYARHSEPLPTYEIAYVCRARELAPNDSAPIPAPHQTSKNHSQSCRVGCPPSAQLRHYLATVEL